MTQKSCADRLPASAATRAAGNRSGRSAAATGGWFPRFVRPLLGRPEFKNHPSQLVVRLEVTIAEGLVESLGRIVGLNAQGQTGEAILLCSKGERFHKSATNSSASHSLNYSYRELGCVAIDEPLSMIVLGEDPVPGCSHQLAIMFRDEAPIPCSSPARVVSHDFRMLESPFKGWVITVRLPKEGCIEHLSEER